MTEVKPGTHWIDLGKLHYINQRDQVEVKAGETKIVTKYLTKETQTESATSQGGTHTTESQGGIKIASAQITPEPNMR